MVWLLALRRPFASGDSAPMSFRRARNAVSGSSAHSPNRSNSFRLTPSGADSIASSANCRLIDAERRLPNSTNTLTSDIFTFPFGRMEDPRTTKPDRGPIYSG